MQGGCAELSRGVASGAFAFYSSTQGGGRSDLLCARLLRLAAQTLCVTAHALEAWMHSPRALQASSAHEGAAERRERRRECVRQPEGKYPAPRGDGADRVVPSVCVCVRAHNAVLGERGRCSRYRCPHSRRGHSGYF